MELAPGSTPGVAMLPHFPLTLTEDLQPCAVQDQMPGPDSILGQAYLHYQLLLGFRYWVQLKLLSPVAKRDQGPTRFVAGIKQ